MTGDRLPDVVSTGIFLTGDIAVFENKLAPAAPLWNKGDLNCDGVAGLNDVDPFVLALTDPAAYAAAVSGCSPMNADTNPDNRVNFDDIDPFIALSGTGAKQVLQAALNGDLKPTPTPWLPFRQKPLRRPRLKARP